MASSRAGRAVIVFRYDDVGAYSAGSRSRALAIDKAVFRTFAEAGLPVVAGVVPWFGSRPETETSDADGRTAESREWCVWLRERCREQKIEIAQHGLTHESLIRDRKSEFHGLPPELQRERILAGKRYLEHQFGQRVRTFIPPWNLYDENTLRVLRDLRFDCISDDWKGGGFSDVLCRIPQTATLGQLPSLLARHDGIPSGSLVVVLFHRYDFASDGSSDEEISTEPLRHVLTLVADRDDLVCLTMSEFSHPWRAQYTKDRHRAAERYVAWASFLSGLPGLGGLVRDHRPGILFPESHYTAANARIGLACSLTILGPLLLGVLAGRSSAWLPAGPGPARAKRAMGVVVLVAAVTLAAVVSGRLASGGTIGPRLACSLVFVGAFSLAWLPFGRRSRSCPVGLVATETPDG